MNRYHSSSKGMNMKKLLLAMLALTAVPAAAVAQNQFITIGTGGVTGTNYAVGGAICRLMNETRSDNGFRCSVESTAASAYKLNAIRPSAVDFGVTHSDDMYYDVNDVVAFASQGEWEAMRG